MSLKELPIKFQATSKGFYSSYHLFIIRLNQNLMSKFKKFFVYLRSKNLFVNLHYLPVHQHPFYSKLGFKTGDYPNSETYAKTSLSIPIYPNLSIKDQKKIISIIIKFFK